MRPPAVDRAGAGERSIMAFSNPSDEAIRKLLSRRLNIAVVGCSPKPEQASHRVARTLLDRGHQVFPVNPNAREILGLEAYPTLRDVRGRIDMVDVFRRSELVAPIVDDAIAIGAEVVWMQLGVIDEVAAERAQGCGLMVVMDRCPAIEYQRLFGG